MEKRGGALINDIDKSRFQKKELKCIMILR
jgi:hypothetical protein